MLGLSDMAMPDQLYLYMVGGQKRPMVSMHVTVSLMKQSVNDEILAGHQLRMFSIIL